MTHCTDLVTSVPASSEVATVFFVLAAFPLDSSPRLKGLSFGITYPPEDLLLVADGTCADFSMESTTWPASGSGIAVTWNATRLSTITEVHWFAAYCYSPSIPTTFAVGPHPSQGGAFADDAVPARIDPIETYGTLGFGCDGVPVCPGESPPRDASVYLHVRNFTCHPLVAAVASLLLAEKPDLTNEDCYEILKRTATNPTGLDPSQVGQGLVRADTALSLVAPDVTLVHATATGYSASPQFVAEMEVQLANVAGVTPMDDAWYPHHVECYRVSTSVDLVVPPGAGVLEVWGRGKSSSGWRRFDEYFENRYDGKLWANYAHVAGGDGARTATFESFTYQVFSADGANFIGWFPVDPTASNDYHVDYTYLWKPLGTDRR
ncbi:MAG: hypothetical protein IPK72_14655 [Candidatus Eisenbacteria bacterium]|nr:hypothetical protein [Candidatus Eisenbacteria bacterium]